MIRKKIFIPTQRNAHLMSQSNATSNNSIGPKK